jgi:hypothetical protein
VKNWWSTLTMRAPQPSIGVCRFVDTTFFVTFRSMTCRLWIFLEAAAGGPLRTFVRSKPRRLRATLRLSFTASDIFSAGYSVGIENRCGRKTHFWNACRNATDATQK